MIRRAGVFLFGLLFRLLAGSRSVPRSPVCGFSGVPGARYDTPAAWTDSDKVNLGIFLKTPTGKKFLLTLHDMTVGRALAVVDRPAFDHGVTGGMSLMLGEIERLAVDHDDGTNESEEQ